MKPYYESGGITIYHADCREVIPSLVADVAITDPPYPRPDFPIHGPVGEGRAQ